MEDLQQESLETQEYVVFELSNEYYCVKINTLDKIIPLIPIRKVPNLPKFIKGIIDYEEQIVPILDLKERMKLPTNNSKEQFILLFEYEERLLGILADSIFELKETNLPPKKEFTYVSEHVHIFSDGTIRMEDKYFSKDRESSEELIIILSIKKIYDIIYKELINSGNIRTS
ncbi:chemotaxis protein CheW [Priestia filamentosa]|uniref:chemotaxis protein CheW n=1 Tax=Priestia filamentosa TaxID=1402861 RepID=UPI00397D2BE0